MGACDGRVALVTGASRGIGLAIAQRLAAEGAAVVLGASRLGEHGPLAGTLEEAVSGIQKDGGRAAPVVANLALSEERRDLVARAEEPFGPLDIIVSNAAMGRFAPPSQTTLAHRRKLLEVNFHAPVDLAQQALPGMRERGRGWIVNVGSDSARQPALPYRTDRAATHSITAYGASKAALERYSVGLAHEVASDGIFVNVVLPVAIVMTQGAEDFAGHIARANPDMAEPMELMVEAALEFATGRHVGQIATSREILHAVGRPVRSLDGRRVLGDAFMPADLGNGSS